MSIYLPNVYRAAFSLDSVVDEDVAQAAAEAYVARTGETIYVPGLGEIAPAASEPEPEPEPEAVATKKAKKSS